MPRAAIPWIGIGPAASTYTGPGGVASEAWWDVGSAGATPSANTHYFTTTNDALQNQEIQSITDRSGHGRTLSIVQVGTGMTWSDVAFNSLGEASPTNQGGMVAVGVNAPPPFSIWFAGQPDTDGTPANEEWFCATSTTGIFVRNAGVFLSMFNQDNDTAANIGVTAHALYTFDYGLGGTAGTMTKYKNGTALGATDTVNSVGKSLANNFYVGRHYDGTLPLTGSARWSEIAVFSSVLTGANLTAVKTYFANKYALTIA